MYKRNLKGKFIKRNNFIDLTGKKFNRLTVIKFSHIKINSFWKCKCICGNYSIVNGQKLKSGHTKSCGCWKKEKTGFKKGHKSFLTEESKKQIGKSNKGRKVTWGDKISKAMKGKKLKGNPEALMKYRKEKRVK